MSVELFSENIFPEPTLSEILGIDSSIRSVGGIIEGTNIKSSSGSGGVAILPPENTDIGLYVYDNEGNTVFNTLIDGDNVGDVYLGDFANNQGIWYDKSAGASGTVYIKGNVYIGGTTVFESGYDPSGKANVFRQDTEPASGMVEKDIWIDTNNGDKPYSYNGSAWIAQYTIIDGGSISTGTIDADLVTVSNLVVGTNVGLGTAEDSAGVTTIVGGVVTTEYLNARNIKAGSIDAEDIIAGTITGSTLKTDVDDDDRIEIGGGYNWLRFYDTSNEIVSSIIHDGTDVLSINGLDAGEGFTASSIQISSGATETISLNAGVNVVMALASDGIVTLQNINHIDTSSVFIANTGSGNVNQGSISYNSGYNAIMVDADQTEGSNLYLLAASGQTVSFFVDSIAKLSISSTEIKFYDDAVPVSDNTKDLGEIDLESDDLKNLKENNPEIKKLSKLTKDITDDMENYRFHLASEKIYHFVWHEFADIIIEKSKPTIGEKNTQLLLIEIFQTILRILHPFMPFITEEIWSELSIKNKQLLIIENWPITN